MDSHDAYTKPSHWRRGDFPSEPPTQQSSSSVLLVGGVIALLLAGSGLFLWGGGSTPTPPMPISGVAAVMATRIPPTLTPSIPPATATPIVLVVTPTNEPMTPTPSCRSASYYLPIITEQERNNKWDVAAENALAALSDPQLCQEDRPLLEQKYVTNALEGLYARPFDATRQGQQEAVERYQTIKAHAQRYGVDFPGTLGVAQRAGQSGKFLLSKVAYDEAYEEGTFNTADQTLVNDYVSNLFNLGKWWTESTDATTYQEGLTYLVASHRIAVKYKTWQGEAWGLLKQLRGPNEATWPEGASTPLLTP